MLGRKEGKTRKLTERISTLIASDVEIKGDVHFKGGIQIDGHIIGNVIAEDDPDAFVRVTEHGYIKGYIKGPHIIINGKIEGDVFSSEHVELAEKSVVEGNVHYNLIEMVIGSQVDGSLIHNNSTRSSDKNASLGNPSFPETDL